MDDDVEILTEPMADGRRIHYYRWPEDDGGRGADDSDAPAEDPDGV